MSNFLTFDAAQISSSGAFLRGELERLDPTLYEPLADYKWARDITLRTDVTLSDDMSSFILTQFGTVGGANAGGKNFIGIKTTEIANVQVGSQKITQPITPWALGLNYSILELQKSQQTGRPIDDQQHVGLRLKWQMDTDEQVYIGDKGLGVNGMLNQDYIAPENATGSWDTLTPDQILEEVNGILGASWKESGFAMVPSDLLLPPLVFGSLATRMISAAGSQSILNYLQKNSISNAEAGRELNIRPSKWCTSAGTAGKTRAMAYTNRNDVIRLPQVQLASTPVRQEDLHFKNVYYGALGVVEVVRPESIAYLDGL